MQANSKGMAARHNHSLYHHFTRMVKQFSYCWSPYSFSNISPVFFVRSKYGPSFCTFVVKCRIIIHRAAIYQESRISLEKYFDPLPYRLWNIWTVIVFDESHYDYISPGWFGTYKWNTSEMRVPYPDDSSFPFKFSIFFRRNKYKSFILVYSFNRYIPMCPMSYIKCMG